MEEMDDEALRNYVLSQIYNIYNIDDVISEYEDRQAKIRENFKDTWNNYETANEFIKKLVNAINLIIIKTFITTFIPSIMNNNVSIEINKYIDVLKKYKVDVKSQKKILIMVKRALKDLEKRSLITCNYDIVELLTLIYEKDLEIITIIEKEGISVESRIKGINTQSYYDEEELKKMNDGINMYILKLGLK